MGILLYGGLYGRKVISQLSVIEVGQTTHGDLLILLNSRDSWRRPETG